MTLKASEEEIIHLEIDTVIGTGDSFDRIALIPLIADWGAPRNCLFNTLSGLCENSIARLYRLRSPIQGHKIVGICEEHHQQLWKDGKHHDPR